MFNLFAGPFLKEMKRNEPKSPPKFWIKSELIRTQWIREKSRCWKPVKKNPLRIDRLKQRSTAISSKLGPKLQIQPKIKTERDAGKTHQQGVATWPHPGRGNAAKAAFPRLFDGCWGSVCSPNLPGILPLWVLPINSLSFRWKWDDHAELGFRLVFHFLV